MTENGHFESLYRGVLIVSQLNLLWAYVFQKKPVPTLNGGGSKTRGELTIIIKYLMFKILFKDHFPHSSYYLYYIACTGNSHKYLRTLDLYAISAVLHKHKEKKESCKNRKRKKEIEKKRKKNREREMLSNILCLPYLYNRKHLGTL